MAFRFRRSVRLGKGVRLNVSKRGVGMSVGTRGLRYSVHSTGRRTQTIGLPGTGLSYVKTKTSSKKRQSNRNVAHKDKDNEAIVKEYNDYIHAITHLHQNTPTEINWEEMKTKPAPFQSGETGPKEAAAIQSYNDFNPNFLKRIIKPLATKEKNRLKESIQEARKQDEETYNIWKSEKKRAEKILAGQLDAYEQLIQEATENEDALRQDLSVHVLDSDTVEIEVQLSPEDVVPDRTLSLTKTGRVSNRKMGKTVYYKIMKDFICSYALWFSRALFSYLPINSCIVHVTENALNTTTGHQESKVLLSVQINKQTLSKLNFDRINPSDAMDNFPHTMNHLKTKGFR